MAGNLVGHAATETFSEKSASLRAHHDQRVAAISRLFQDPLGRQAISNHYVHAGGTRFHQSFLPALQSLLVNAIEFVQPMLQVWVDPSPILDVQQSHRALRLAYYAFDFLESSLRRIRKIRRVQDVSKKMCADSAAGFSAGVLDDLDAEQQQRKVGVVQDRLSRRAKQSLSDHRTPM